MDVLARMCGSESYEKSINANLSMPSEDLWHVRAENM